MDYYPFAKFSGFTFSRFGFIVRHIQTTQTNTHRITDAAKRLTHATVVGVNNNVDPLAGLQYNFLVFSISFNLIRAADKTGFLPIFDSTFNISSRRRQTRMKAFNGIYLWFCLCVCVCVCVFVYKQRKRNVYWIHWSRNNLWNRKATAIRNYSVSVPGVSLLLKMIRRQCIGLPA